MLLDMFFDVFNALSCTELTVLFAAHAMRFRFIDSLLWEVKKLHQRSAASTKGENRMRLYMIPMHCPVTVLLLLMSAHCWFHSWNLMKAPLNQLRCQNSQSHAFKTNWNYLHQETWAVWSQHAVRGGWRFSLQGWSCSTQTQQSGHQIGEATASISSCNRIHSWPHRTSQEGWKRCCKSDVRRSCKCAWMVPTQTRNHGGSFSDLKIAYVIIPLHKLFKT